MAVLGLRFCAKALVVASGGHSSSRCAGLSLSRPLLLRSAGSVIVAHGPSCSAACGILPDQGSNLCPLHRQADPQPPRHQGSPLIELLKGHSKSVSEAYLSNLSLDEDQMPHDLQPGNYAYWKRHNLKNYLQPRWKDPYQVLLHSPCTVKLKGIDSWINFHSQRAPALDRPIEGMADLKITLKPCSNRGETTLTTG